MFVVKALCIQVWASHITANDDDQVGHPICESLGNSPADSLHNSTPTPTPTTTRSLRLLNTHRAQTFTLITRDPAFTRLPLLHFAPLKSAELGSQRHFLPALPTLNSIRIHRPPPATSSKSPEETSLLLHHLPQPSYLLPHIRATAKARRVSFSPHHGAGAIFSSSALHCLTSILIMP